MSLEERLDICSQALLDNLLKVLKKKRNFVLEPSPLIKRFSNFVPVWKINSKGLDTEMMYRLVS